MTNRAKALVAVGLLSFWGIATIAASDAGKADPKSPGAAKPDANGPTTRKAPTMPPLKPIEPILNLTPQQEAELLAALKESSPDQYYAYLMALKKSSPELYKQSLGNAWRKYEQWRNAPKDVREQVMAESEAGIEIGKLVSALRDETDPVKRSQLAAQLRKAVARKFDAEIVIRDYRIAQFEERIKALRAELKERIENRTLLINEQFVEWMDRARQQPSTQPTTPPK